MNWTSTLIRCVYSLKRSRPKFSDACYAFRSLYLNTMVRRWWRSDRLIHVTLEEYMIALVGMWSGNEDPADFKSLCQDHYSFRLFADSWRQPTSMIEAL